MTYPDTLESKTFLDKSKLKDYDDKEKYVIFSHEIIYHLAKWMPVDIEDSHT